MARKTEARKEFTTHGIIVTITTSITSVTFPRVGSDWAVNPSTYVTAATAAETATIEIELLTKILRRFTRPSSTNRRKPAYPSATNVRSTATSQPRLSNE